MEAKQILLITVFLSVTLAEPSRIIDGSLTTINAYPYASAVLISSDFVTFTQSCGGTIITGTAILTAAHCFDDRPINEWGVRVGSSYAHSGGTVHALRLINNHPNYHPATTESDISVVRTQTFIAFIANTVIPASIAGNFYNVADNQPVWAIGWGHTTSSGPASEQLCHIQIFTVNQELCRQRYAELGRPLTDNMLCAGRLDVAGHTQCTRDSGGPLIHNNVVMGICSFGTCGNPRYPTVNVRVSRFTSWIQAASA